MDIPVGGADAAFSRIRYTRNHEKSVRTNKFGGSIVLPGENQGTRDDQRAAHRVLQAQALF